MTPPRRRPRLMAQRHDAEARALRVAEKQRVREVAARRAAEGLERDRARKRRATSPFARGAETAGGWILSILGALIVSVLLTWLLRHPETLRMLVDAVRRCGR